MAIFVYPRLPADEIRKTAKETIPQIEEWFVKNPNKDICQAELWYGNVVAIKRGDIAVQVNAEAERVISEEPSRIELSR